MVYQKSSDIRQEKLPEESLWYKDAIIYELHVRAFRDSNGDGVGDFRGLTEKLDYIEGLGANTIWLLPFYPSPLRDDGYDISDYFNIHPDYGTLRDFRSFLRAAHKRGLRVIAELVLNHTSSDHSWFQQSRRAKPNTRRRNMYVWSDTPDRYKDARIIFKDFESSNWSWDPVAKAYFWHRFYSHQPDLNFDEPLVHKNLFRVIDFWFSMGVDGLRLDAVPYLYEREGTNCENLPETHNFLKKLRAHVDASFSNKMFLAEANQWPEDSVAYFGDGDECHMSFHFPLMPRMFMALQMEDSFPIADILRSTPPIPQICQWALFLRNHDELTLEMVTDEERDYMYRVYAKDTRAKINLGIRRRLAPLLSNDRRKIELMNILLFSLPGTPIIYYGDEIGMGDNYYLGDRNGVRTPMQWGPDRNAGFSEANPHRLYLPVIIDPEYHFEALNVRNQESSISSLLWWMRGVIAMRKRFRAFSRGSFEIISGDNPRVFAYCRQYEDEIILVIVNLSKFSQVVNLEMPKFAGLVPEEVFGRTIFPIIKEGPYMVIMGPNDYYWLLLGKSREEIGIAEELMPSMKLKKSWETIFSGKSRQVLEERLFPRYLVQCRWFSSKTRKIEVVKIVRDICFKGNVSNSHLLILKVIFTDRGEEYYLLPVSFAYKTAQKRISSDFPQAVITDILVDDKEGYIYDGTYDEDVHDGLLNLIVSRKNLRGSGWTLAGSASSRQLKAVMESHGTLASRPLKVEQSNSAIVFGDVLFLKLYRRLEEGVNPELEMMRFLSQDDGFVNTPAFMGAIEYRRGSGQPFTIAILQSFVENSGDSWSYVSGMVARYFEQVLSKKSEAGLLPQSYPQMREIRSSDIPSSLSSMVGEFFFEMISLLGKRTAQMHLALGRSQDDPVFKPESFSYLYQRSLYQSIQGLVQRNFRLLEKRLEYLPDEVRDLGKEVISMEKRIIETIKRITSRRITSTKIRIHGDYHLGQVLYTGKDFVIMDFEGEPARPLSERKLKRSPFRDVAGMVRSFHYAAHGTLFLNPTFRSSDYQFLETWIEPWYHYVSGIFLRSYLDTTGESSFVPREAEQIDILFQTFLLEKAVYELGYELNNRPEWVIIPLKGILHIMKSTGVVKS
jgi:maltose alpha-D-glucosyltransferase/alpha-amylase